MRIHRRGRGVWAVIQGVLPLNHLYSDQKADAHGAAAIVRHAGQRELLTRLSLTENLKDGSATLLNYLVSTNRRRRPTVTGRYYGSPRDEPVTAEILSQSGTIRIYTPRQTFDDPIGGESEFGVCHEHCVPRRVADDPSRVAFVGWGRAVTVAAAGTRGWRAAQRLLAGRVTAG